MSALRANPKRDNARRGGNLGSSGTRLPGAGQLSLAFLALVSLWTKARGFLARVIAGSAMATPQCNPVVHDRASTIRRRRRRMGEVRRSLRAMKRWIV
jgi:hypothetical protein